MGYVELIEKLQSLPTDKQFEVIDFVEFLASRTKQATMVEGNKSKSALSELRARPLTVRDFSPMSREEANVR
jgi:hypothetical protein